MKHTRLASHVLALFLVIVALVTVLYTYGNLSTVFAGTNANYYGATSYTYASPYWFGSGTTLYTTSEIAGAPPGSNPGDAGIYIGQCENACKNNGYLSCSLQATYRTSGSDITGPVTIYECDGVSTGVLSKIYNAGTGGGTAPGTQFFAVYGLTADISASPGTIQSGQSTTLTYSSVNADKCAIDNGVGPVGTGGGTKVSPTTTTTYTLSCTGGATDDPGLATDSVTVKVSGTTATPTATLGATPRTLDVNNKTKLSWSCGGSSTFMRLTDNNGSNPGNTNTGLPLTGSVYDKLTSVGTHIFTLLCTDGSGGSDTATVNVAVSSTNADYIGGFTSPGSAVLGQSQAFTADATNVGDANGTNVPNSFQISGVGYFAASTLSSLNASVTKNVTGTYTFNTYPAGGTYNIRMCANTNTSGAQVQPESKTNNDCGPWKSVAVKAPDLTAGSVTPTAAAAGPVTLSATVTNNGSIGSGSFSNKWQQADDGSGTNTRSLPSDASGSIASGGSAVTSTTATLSAGTSWVRVCADNPDTITESDEGNNCGPWTAIKAVDATCSVSPTSASIGDSVTWTAVPAGGNGTYTYSWGGTDGLSGSGQSVSKSYSTTGAKTANVTVTSLGASKYVACSNNVNIGAAAAPDLTAGAITPVTVDLGVSTPLSATITNIGNATTGPLNSTFRNVLQTATDSSGTGAIGIATQTGSGPLSAGSTWVTSINYTANTTDIFWARICADSGSQVAESLENNNCGPWTRIDVRAPDITAGDTTAGSAVVGQATALSSTITNTGDTTGTSVPNVFQVLSPSDRIAATVIASIGSGITKPITGSYTFPAVGDYSVRACGNMDTTGNTVIAESHTGNNCGAWLTVTVNPAPIPDLTATVISADNTTVTVGDTVSFTGTIWNKGSGDASGFPNILDVLNTSQRATSPASMSLTAGATGAATGSYTFTTAGTYQVRFCANTNTSWVNIVPESDYGNNCGNKVTITVNPPPDPTCKFNPSSISASPNQPVTINWSSSDSSPGHCDATANSFSTGGALLGSAVVNPDLSSGSATYAMTCTRLSDNKQSVPCNVTISNSCGNNAPSISVNQNRVKQGTPVTISWTASGISSSACTISGPGINTSVSASSCAIPSGSQTVTITKQSVFTITCGSKSDSVTVNVVPKLIEF